MSPFKALETTIKKQDDEIERLKNTQKVRTPIKAKGCPRGFLNFNIKTLMNTDGFFGQQRSLICPPRRGACSKYCCTLLTDCIQAALSTRDLARTSQQKQEVSLLSEGKDRDKKLSEHRSV